MFIYKIFEYTKDILQAPYKLYIFHTYVTLKMLYHINSITNKDSWHSHPHVTTAVTTLFYCHTCLMKRKTYVVEYQSIQFLFLLIVVDVSIFFLN